MHRERWYASAPRFLLQPPHRLSDKGNNDRQGQLWPTCFPSTPEFPPPQHLNVLEGRHKGEGITAHRLPLHGCGNWKHTSTPLTPASIKVSSLSFFLFFLFLFFLFFYFLFFSFFTIEQIGPNKAECGSVRKWVLITYSHNWTVGKKCIQQTLIMTVLL